MTDRVTLNIGGELFTTSRDTLLKLKDTIFEELIGRPNGLWPAASTEKEIFIDRDPDVFRHILGFLRGYPVCADKENLKLVYEDAIYYHIEPLAEMLRKELGIRTVEEETRFKNECLNRLRVLEIAHAVVPNHGLTVDSETEEIEAQLSAIEAKDEEASIEAQAKMFLNWGPYLASIICPALEKYFGISLYGLQISWESYLPYLRNVIREYRGKQTVGSWGELLFKFGTDVVSYAQTAPSDGPFNVRLVGVSSNLKVR